MPCTKHQLTKAQKRGKNYASQKVWMHTCVMQCSTKSSRQYWELKLDIDTVPQQLPWEASFQKDVFQDAKSIPWWHRNPIFCSVSVTLRWRRSWHPQIASAVAIAQETFTLVVILHVSEYSLIEPVFGVETFWVRWKLPQALCWNIGFNIF